LRGHTTLNAALASITAAVVGIILNLGVIFGITVLFDEVRRGELLGMTFPIPQLASIDLFALTLATVVFVGLWRYRWSIPWVVAISAAAGFVYRVIF
jgi:chromate transporter